LWRGPGSAGHPAAVTATSTPAAGAPAATAGSGDGGSGDGGGGGGSAERAGAELRRAGDAAIRRAVGVIAACWQAILLAALIASLDRVRSPAAAVALWVATTAGVAAAGWTGRRRPLRRAEAAALVTVVFAAMAAGVLNARGLDVLRYPDWPLVVPHAATALVVVSRPLREWLPAGLAAGALMLALPIAAAGADPLVLTRAGIYTYIMFTFMVILAALGPMWSSGAQAAARAAEADAGLGARQEAAAAIRRDRARGLRQVERTLLPLLRSIADGELDPRDPDVRRRCAHEAAILRRRLRHGETPSSLGTIEQALEAAEERGVDVEVQVAGDFRHTPAGLREEIAGWVRAALDGLRSGRATLTALCSEGSGSMVLSFPAGAGAGAGSRAVRTGGAGGPAVPPAAATAASPNGGGSSGSRPAPGSGLDVRTDVADGRAFLEMSWGASAAPA
jgi:hypothetical protein